MNSALRPLLMVAILIPLASHAETGNFEVTPYAAFSAGGKFNDEDSDFDADLQDSGSAGLVLNFRQTSNTQWELLYSQQKTEALVNDSETVDDVLDLDVHYLHFGGTYQGDGDRFRPYLAATIGASHFDVREAGYNSDTFFSFSIGPGLQIWPNNRVGVRLEARAFGTLVNSGTNLFCVSDPGGGTAGCAVSIAGEVLWQFQAMAGVVFRF